MRLLLGSLLVLLLFHHRPLSAQTLTPDAQAVQTALLNYLHGNTLGDVARLSSSLHTTVTLLRENEATGTFSEVPVANFLEEARLHEDKHLRRLCRIKNYAIEDNAAQAKLVSNYGSWRLIEYANLLKINGQWKIVHVVSNREIPPVTQ